MELMELFGMMRGWMHRLKRDPPTLIVEADATRESHFTVTTFSDRSPDLVTAGIDALDVTDVNRTEGDLQIS